jgi:hypothetical protein
VPYVVKLSVLAKGWNIGAKIGCPHDVMAARVYEHAQGFKPEWTPYDAEVVVDGGSVG